MPQMNPVWWCLILLWTCSLLLGGVSSLFYSPLFVKKGKLHTHHKECITFFE
nr:ATP synthase F0 subunit 8 [Saemundssonia lari]